MQLSKEQIEKYKAIHKKEFGEDLSDQDACEAAYNLCGFAELAFDGWVRDQQRKRRLEESPKGFHLEGVGYTCFICGGSASNEQSWYDRYGIKCMTCQRAIDRKEIPPSLAKDKESWYCKYDMESRFNLKGPALRQWIKAGILKARTVTNDGKGVHVQLFLIKDNKGFLPPKKLTESQLVKETRDGQDWFHSEPWYKFVDAYEHLKGYKIMDYLRPIKEEDGAEKQSH